MFCIRKCSWLLLLKLRIFFLKRCNSTDFLNTLFQIAAWYFDDLFYTHKLTPFSHAGRQKPQNASRLAFRLVHVHTSGHISSPVTTCFNLCIHCYKLFFLQPSNHNYLLSPIVLEELTCYAHFEWETIEECVHVYYDEAVLSFSLTK